MSNEEKTNEPNSVSRALVFMIDRLCLISVMSPDPGAVKAAVDGLDQAIASLPAAFHDIRMQSTAHYAELRDAAASAVEANTVETSSDAIVEVK